MTQDIESRDDDKDSLKRNVKQIERAYEAASSNLKRYSESVKFNLGQQWNDEDSSAFRALQKPMFTFNRLYSYIKTIIGEQITNTPDLQVRSTNTETSQQSVDLYTGLIRHISYASKFKSIIQHCFKCQLIGGYGVIKVATDYESDDSFNQIIKIEKGRDPKRFYFDPDAKESTKSDGDFCGETFKMRRKEYNEKYKDEKGAESFDIQDDISDNVDWGDEDYITLAEHYVKEYYDKTIVQLPDGQVIDQSEYNDMVAQVKADFAEQFPDQEMPPMPEVKKRKVRAYKIKCYIQTRNKILEEYDWPSKLLPIVYADGDSFLIDGKEEIKSYTYFAHDAQRFYNYTVSNIAEALKNARKEQWIGTPENIEGSDDLLDMWQNPERVQGILLANRDGEGQLPTKIPPGEISNSLINTKGLLESDMQNIVGRHEASQGMSGQEVSGVALTARIMQNNAGVNEQFNNLYHAVEQVGRIILDLIPSIYDSSRDVTIQTKEGDKKNVRINSYDQAYGMEQNSVEKGNFDIEVEVGASFAVQKAEALDKLLKLISIAPQQVFPLLADVVAKNIDLENTNEIVERLTNLVPPAVIAKEKGLPPPKPQPNPQAQMAQMQMQFEMQKLQLEQGRLQLDQQKLAADKEEQLIKARTADTQQQIDAMQLQQEAASIQMKGVIASKQAQTQAIKANAEVQSNAMKMVTEQIKGRQALEKALAPKTNARGRSKSAASANVQR